jgi:magnesium-protoporphyrin IX monomethyl ester (oxidative) cyclase
MYSELYLRLEPLGLERVAAAVRARGHEVRLIDLQVYRHADLWREVLAFQPEAVGFSLNYLANVPEVVDLAKETKRLRPSCFVFVGGHSVSFVAEQVLSHADGAIDAIIKGEGEEITPELLDAFPDGGIEHLPGIVALAGSGPAPRMMHSLDEHLPARDIGGRRKKYFIGELDPCASIEFSRGCPWDCAFCSAWTFYGRAYRKVSPEVAADDLASIKEPNVFIVDDVAFIRPEHGMAIGHEIERRGIRKRYYLETRCDVLLRNREVFEYWKRLGLRYMFLGIEALDEEGLKTFRKRSTPGINFEALEVARKLGIIVDVNIIADPAWDERRFEVIREWALSIPEIVHLTVQTPYPGTETWLTESRKLATLDYRLFDIQHAVLPTRLPLERFYAELVKTQAVLAKKHLGVAALLKAGGIVAGHLRHGQTNFVRMIWKFNTVYNPQRQLSDHQRQVHYQMPSPQAAAKLDRRAIFIHPPARLEKSRVGSANSSPLERDE